MTRYDNYNPEINIGEELPKIEESEGDAKEPRRRSPRAKRGSEEQEGRGKSRRRDRASREDTSNHRRKPVSRRKNDDDKGESTSDSILSFFTSTSFRLIVGIILGGFAIYLGVAFISYFSECVRDQASIANAPIGKAVDVGNAAGEGGARLSEFLINQCFGLGSLVIVIWMACISLKLLIGRPRFKTLNFTIKCLVALITLSLIVGVLTLSVNSLVNWGGYHGRYVNEFLIHFLGWTGAVILCLLSLAIFVVICMRDVVKWILKKRSEFLAKRREISRKKAEEEAAARRLEEIRLREAEEAAAEAKEQSDDIREGDELVKFNGYEISDSDEDPYVGNTAAEVAQQHEYYSIDDNLEPSEPAKPSESTGLSHDTVSSEVSQTSDSKESSENQEIIKSAESPESEVSPEKPMVVNVNTIAQVEQKRHTLRDELATLARHYKFPPAELLLPGTNKVSVDEIEQEANKKRIRETLLYHGIPITDIEATVGPTITLYEIRPDQGIKIAKIKNLADDIALSLSAIGVRIIAPIPGKGTVGIEVANNEPQTVSMRTIIQSRKYQDTKYRLPVALGSTIGNDVYIADLAKMPHLLVAGATGQGKSVGLNAIIASLLFKKRPHELKFVMIDPKEVEFSLYAKIEKHYLAKIPGETDAIVTDMSKVVATLSSLCVEMDNRYKLLRSAQVRNIEEYNPLVLDSRLNVEEGHRFMPYIVVVVDEFADLIMTSGKEVEMPIARLAQKARAVGIHVIIATQRPSTNVITGIIKANFPVRIAFKVTSGVDSKTILDTTGAQQLIGRGDMLISSNSQMTRVQCAFIDTPEVGGICEYISKQPCGTGAYILPEPLQTGDGDHDGGKGYVGDRDPLFEEAGKYVVGSGTASTSALQRHFSIGYNRAGKIMDQLESHGVVGPATGGKPRDLLVDPAGFERLLASL